MPSPIAGWYWHFNHIGLRVRVIALRILCAYFTRSLIRAVRVAGKVEPLFVETTDELPEAIVNMAQAGDVVIVMGAGSIGHVAEQTRELATGELANVEMASK